ncbi:hypothetical protein [uncultured Piscinibacter sp.]|uniref:hypothetical protein n=1 Tax=uncultured Piscinibacter sp. TaxID=1131835 RepID=UPI002639A080|nr:hypothetical protein [uncultured Piscinibacter sp.]
MSMVKFDASPASPRCVPAPRDPQGCGEPVEHGWFLSSFDLARGLRVVEADDEDLRSLFGTVQPQ